MPETGESCSMLLNLCWGGDCNMLLYMCVCVWGGILFLVSELRKLFDVQRKVTYDYVKMMIVV
jgi:hypothetical protein